MHYAHTPVLLNEVLEGLNIQPGGKYIDCTFGRGGHSKAIINRLDSSGCLLAMDRDPEVMNMIDNSLKDDNRFIFNQCSFDNLDKTAQQYNIHGLVNGIIFDLGVSSPQLDDPDRGFSFLHEGPLDMRMDNTKGISACEWLNSANEKDLRGVIKKYGEERFAGRIAKRIVSVREQEKIKTTLQLANLISNAVPKREKDKHPATRTFQAIRIHINNELAYLELALKKSVNVLTKGGRLLVISFHSLEDRIVKQFMKQEASGDCYPSDLPIKHEFLQPALKIIGKPVYPDSEEKNENRRSRSAVLRIAEKII